MKKLTRVKCNCVCKYNDNGRCEQKEIILTYNQGGLYCNKSGLSLAMKKMIGD